jgi:hypothetical protein
MSIKDEKDPEGVSRMTAATEKTPLENKSRY